MNTVTMTDAERSIIINLLTRLLARREHSRAELLRKCQQRDMDMATVNRLLDEFAEQGLQSDTRFAESFVRQRYQNGYGERRIQAELSQRQVSDDDARQAFAELEADWFESARRVYQRKYARPIQDQKDRLKRLRFMQYRGFTQEQARYAMESEDSDY